MTRIKEVKKMIEVEYDQPLASDEIIDGRVEKDATRLGYMNVEMAEILGAHYTFRLYYGDYKKPGPVKMSSLR